MSVLRFAALVAVVLTGGCSRLPSVPTAYSALPSVRGSGVPDTALAASAGPVAALPAVVMPGTFEAPASEHGPPGMNPTAALDASRRSRLAWEVLRPADLLRPPALGTASAGIASPGAASTGRSAVADGTGRAGLDRPGRPTIATLTYDREATMDRLLSGSRTVAGRICSGC